MTPYGTGDGYKGVLTGRPVRPIVVITLKVPCCAMLLSLLQAAVICFVSWALWRVVRPYVVKTSLSNIRGPRPQSLWKGELLHRYELHIELNLTFALPVFSR